MDEDDLCEHMPRQEWLGRYNILMVLVNRANWKGCMELLDKLWDPERKRYTEFFNCLCNPPWEDRSDFDGLYWAESTPLHVAAYNGAPTPLFRALLKETHGYDHFNGNEVIFNAAQQGRARIVALLLKAGHDPNFCRKDLNVKPHFGFETAREIAVDNERPKVIAVLDAYDEVLTLAMCLRHYDKIHEQQCLKVSATELHGDIIALKASAKRFTIPSSGVNVSAAFLHDLYGHEKELVKKIFCFLLGENYEDDGKNAFERRMHEYRSRQAVFDYAAGMLESEAERWRAATSLQKVGRGSAARREARERVEAATRLQSVQRGRRGSERASSRRKEVEEQVGAAGKLQSVQRGRVARRRVDERREERREQSGAASKLQSVQRGKLGRKAAEEKRVRVEEEKAAVTKLQSIQRGRLSKKKVELKREERDGGAAATKVQQIQRGRLARREMLEKQESAKKMQSIMRGKKAREGTKMKKKENVASTKLQAVHRGGEGRKLARQKSRARSMDPLADPVDIGDIVKASLAGEGLWFEGVVIGKEGMECDIDFGEGDVQEHIPISSVRKVSHWDILEVGDQVKAPVPHMPSLKCDATIAAYAGELPGGDILYKVQFDDGEEAVLMKAEMVKVMSNRTKAVYLWHKGKNAVSAAGAFGDKKWGAYRRLSSAALNIDIEDFNRAEEERIAKEKEKEEGKEKEAKKEEGRKPPVTALGAGIPNTMSVQ